MSFYHNPRVTTDGLVIYYDAKNYKSVETGSFTWKNLASDDYDLTVRANPTFSNDGYFGRNHSWNIGDHTALTYGSASSWAFSQWQKQRADAVVWTAFCGDAIQGAGGAGGYFYYAPTLRYYQDYDPEGGGVYYGVMNTNPGGPFTFIPTKGEWFNITISYSGTTKSCSVMVNGDEFVEAKPVRWSPRPIVDFRFKYVGGINASGYGFEGYIATHMVWNREISLEENKTNYIATKGRFGK